MCGMHPIIWKEKVKNESYEVLVHLRNDLLSQIEYFEKFHDYILKMKHRTPDPDARYQSHLKELMYLSKILQDRFTSEYKKYKQIDNIIKFSKNAGYDYALPILKWNEFNVYRPYPEYEDCKKEYPNYILQNGKEIRWATNNEQQLLIKEISN